MSCILLLLLLLKHVLKSRDDSHRIIACSVFYYVTLTSKKVSKEGSEEMRRPWHYSQIVLCSFPAL